MHTIVCNIVDESYCFKCLGSHTNENFGVFRLTRDLSRNGKARVTILRNIRRKLKYNFRFFLFPFFHIIMTYFERQCYLYIVS